MPGKQARPVPDHGENIAGRLDGLVGNNARDPGGAPLLTGRLVESRRSNVFATWSA
jgi:hypothetical protein